MLLELLHRGSGDFVDFFFRVHPQRVEQIYKTAACWCVRQKLRYLSTPVFFEVRPPPSMSVWLCVVSDDLSICLCAYDTVNDDDDDDAFLNFMESCTQNMKQKPPK